MTLRAPTMGRVSGRLRLAVAGAAVLTALTAAIRRWNRSRPAGPARQPGCVRWRPISGRLADHGVDPAHQPGYVGVGVALQQPVR